MNIDLVLPPGFSTYIYCTVHYSPPHFDELDHRFYSFQVLEDLEIEVRLQLNARPPLGIIKTKSGSWTSV